MGVDETGKDIFPLQVDLRRMFSEKAVHCVEITDGRNFTVCAGDGFRPWKIGIVGVNLSVVKDRVGLLALFKKSKSHGKFSSSCPC